MFATLLTNSQKPKFINEPFKTAKELLDRVTQLNLGAELGRHLTVEVRLDPAQGTSRFLYFDAFSLEDAKARMLFFDMLDGCRAKQPTLELIQEKFDTWQPSQVEGLLPHALRLPLIQWIGTNPDALSSGKWRFGGFLVWLDTTSSPQLRFRYSLISALFGRSAQARSLDKLDQSN